MQTPDFNDSPLLRAAYEFARDAHHGPRRRGDTDIEHPVEVARLLRDAGYPDELVAAALLHDVLEDTDTSPAEIEQRFGTTVTGLVRALTEDPTIGDYAHRKGALREQIAGAGPEAEAIFAADKLARARELRRSGTPAEAQKLRHYREAFNLLRRRRPELPFVGDFGAELARLDSARGAEPLRPDAGDVHAGIE
jgi:(p)ppGpp synthase/HD superfamily hydrolase